MVIGTGKPDTNVGVNKEKPVATLLPLTKRN
jgi:hypothetical protein